LIEFKDLRDERKALDFEALLDRVAPNPRSSSSSAFVVAIEE